MKGRDQAGDGGDDQAVAEGLPYIGIAEYGLVPVQREVTERNGRKAVRIEREDEARDDRGEHEREHHRNVDAQCSRHDPAARSRASPIGETDRGERDDEQGDDHRARDHRGARPLLTGLRGVDDQDAERRRLAPTEVVGAHEVAEGTG